MKRPDDSLRLQLEHNLLAFRVARRLLHVEDGWIRATRRREGLPAAKVAERLGVKKREILRLEAAEKAGKITLKKLRRLAEAMGYEVIHAIVPKEGSSYAEIAEAVIKGAVISDQ
jgi:transcriptional regulator with XRE-family HTH domain